MEETFTLHNILIVAACFLQQTFAIGTIVNLGLFTGYFLDEFQVTNAQVSLIMSFALSSIFGAGLFSYGVMKKFGCKASCFVSAIVASLSLIVASFLNNFLLIVIVLGPIAGLACCIQYIAYCYVIADIFESQRKRTVFFGFSNAGVGIGCTIMPLIFSYFLSEFTWRQALLIAGALLLNLIPASMLMPKKLKTNETKYAISTKILTVFKNSYFIFTFVCCFFLSLFNSSAFYTFISPLLLEQGLQVSNIGVIFMLFGIASIPGRLGIPYLANFFTSPIPCWCFVCILLTFCQIILLFCGYIWSVTIIVSCFIGFFYGGTTLYCAVISYIISDDNLHLALSLLCFAFGFGGLLGPVVIGLLVDALDDYQYPLLIGYLVSIIFYVIFAVWDTIKSC